MAYIHSISITNDKTYLIEPLLYSVVTGTNVALSAEIDNFTLVPGAYVNLKVGTVSANATLSIQYNSNDATSPAYIYYNGAQIESGVLTENNIYTFIYDGIHWNVVGDITGKNIMIGTTQEWSSHSTYSAPSGTIVIYTDHGEITTTVNDQEVRKKVPGIKIADGSTPIIDLPFVGDDEFAVIYEEINTFHGHINNSTIHVTSADKTKWNAKLNCNDEVINNNLIFTRE